MTSSRSWFLHTHYLQTVKWLYGLMYSMQVKFIHIVGICLWFIFNSKVSYIPTACWFFDFSSIFTIALVTTALPAVSLWSCIFSARWRLNEAMNTGLLRLTLILWTAWTCTSKIQNFYVQTTDTATVVLKPILVSIAFFVGSGNESNVSALSCKLINPAENWVFQ